MKYHVVINGMKFFVTVEDARDLSPAPAPTPILPSPSYSSDKRENIPSLSPGSDSSGRCNITSPMPGTILEVRAAEGQSVTAGEVIVVLEAMKMENDIVAPVNGVIMKLSVTKGCSVETDDILAVIG